MKPTRLEALVAVAFALFVLLVAGWNERREARQERKADQHAAFHWEAVYYGLPPEGVKAYELACERNADNPRFERRRALRQLALHYSGDLLPGSDAEEAVRWAHR